MTVEIATGGRRGAPSPGGAARRRDASTPGRASAGAAADAVVIRPLRRGPGFGPVPAGIAVGLELLALGVLVAVYVEDVWWRAVAGGLLIVVGLLCLVRPGGGSAWAALARRLAFLTRGRTRSVAAYRRRMTSGGAAGAGTDVALPDDDPADGWTREDVPDDLATLFGDDLLAVVGQGRPGRPFGAYRHAGRWGVVLRVRASDEVLADAGTVRLPVDRLTTRLAAVGVPGVGARLVRMASGRDASATPAKLAAIVTELGGDGAGLGLRSARDVLCFLSVDPVAAAEAVEIRGGGAQGISRVLSVLIDVTRMELTEAGLQVEVLARDDVVAAIGRLLAEPVRATDGVATWTESASHVASDRVCHRTLAASRWDVGAGTTALLAVPAHAVVTAVDLRVLPDGGAITTLLVRVSARSLPQLDEATRAVRQVATDHGLALRPLPCDQLSALLATAGPGVC